MVVEVLFGQRHVFDGLGVRTRLELHEPVDPEPAHETGSLEHVTILPAAGIERLRQGPVNQAPAASLASMNFTIMPTVNRSWMFSTFGSLANLSTSAWGKRLRSSATPAGVSEPSLVSVGSAAAKLSGNNSPRGILTLNAFSKRKTISRKSIDSAPRSPISVASIVHSDSSAPSASTRISRTFS